MSVLINKDTKVLVQGLQVKTVLSIRLRRLSTAQKWSVV